MACMYSQEMYGLTGEDARYCSISSGWTYMRDSMSLTSSYSRSQVIPS